MRTKYSQKQIPPLRIVREAQGISLREVSRRAGITHCGVGGLTAIAISSAHFPWTSRLTEGTIAGNDTGRLW